MPLAFAASVAPSPPPLSPSIRVRFLSSSCCSCPRSFPSSSSRSNIFFGRTTGKTNGERGRRPKSRGGDDELNALDMLLRGRGEEATSSSSSSDENEDEDSPQSAEKKKPMTTKPVVVVREITVDLDEETAIDVSVRVDSASSRVVHSSQYPPLGVIVEPTREGVIITEVTDASSPFRANDIIRAVSGMIPTMKYGQGNLLLGGNGRPGFKRVMCTVRSALEIREEEEEEDEDEERLLRLIDMEFETCLKAIQSNGKAGDYEVVLVVERRVAAAAE